MSKSRHKLSHSSRSHEAVGEIGSLGRNHRSQIHAFEIVVSTGIAGADIEYLGIGQNYFRHASDADVFEQCSFFVYVILAEARHWAVLFGTYHLLRTAATLGVTARLFSQHPEAFS